MVMRTIVIILILATTITALVFFRSSNTNDSQMVNPVPQSTTIEPTYCSFIPYWDFEDSIAEYNNQDFFNTVSPFVYTLQEDGSLKRNAKYIDMLTNISGSDILPTINNDFDPERVSEILRDLNKRSQHIDEIVLITINDNVDGVLLDYELLYAQDKNQFSAFVEALSKALHGNDKMLYLAVHPKRSDTDSWTGSEAQDWRKLGISADKIILMAYDYSWTGSNKPGPIAPYFWVNDIVNYAKKTIPKEKIVLGFGVYGYDWGEKEHQAEILTINELNTVLEDNEGKIYFDDDFQSPYMTYQDNTNHIVWYENEKSLKKKLELTKNLSGFCIWRSGGIPDKYYNVFEEYVEL